MTSFFSSTMQAIGNAAQKVAPGMFHEQKMEPASSPSLKGKMIPVAPALPSEEDLNRHYLSRDKTIENATHRLSSYYHFVEEVAVDLKAALPSAETLKTVIPSSIGLGPHLDENNIPIAPPMPTEEMLHKHYLIPLAPALPTQAMLHKHFLIPQAPPLPTLESTHRHYLSRDKTFENASNILRSAAAYMSGFAADLKQNIPSAADLGLATKLDSRGIPIPPPLPTEEMLHKHYLMPLAPPLPTRQQLHGHYLVPLAPPLPRGTESKHWMSRDKTIENAQSSMMSYIHTAQEYAVDIKDAVVHSAPTLSTTSRIPAPPALPTKEMLHKHYLVPLAPALPREQDLNKHWMSRDKTIENAGSVLSHALSYVAEVATEVKDYIVETPISEMTADVREALNPTPLDSQGIPIPPALPTREMLHRHHVIPIPPALPTEASFNKHWMSRDRTIENAGSAIRSAVNLAGEMALGAKDAVVDGALAARDVVVDGVNSIPAAAEEAGNYASDKVTGASQTFSDAMESVVDGAVQLKDRMLSKGASPRMGMKYSRSEVISESPIIKKKSAGTRRITPRTDYNGFKALLHGISQ